MTFGDLASLMVALSDLKVVEDVIRAMDAPSPMINAPSTIRQGAGPAASAVVNRDTGMWRERFDCGNRQCGSEGISVRPTISTPPARQPDTYEPRPVDCCTPAAHPATPLTPLWRTLPPVVHETVVIRPKVFVQTVDLINKGTLIDLFM